MTDAVQLQFISAVNPVLPAVGNVLWSVTAVLILALVLTALSTIWASRNQGSQSRICWTALVLLLPVIGAITWFIVRGSVPQRKA